MKIESLEIKNIGKIKDEVIEFNQSLNLFYGEILQGKTTILNAVKYCLGGSFPKDLITHGEETALIHLKFNNGSIKRTFYITKEGEIKSRPVEFVLDGEIIKKPTDKILTLINPFLLDQNFLINKSINDTKKYFVDLLNIDTSEVDKELSSLIETASDLRADIKAAGDKELEVVKDPGTEEGLNKKKDALTANAVTQKNYDDKLEAIKIAEKRVVELYDQLKELPKPRGKEIIESETNNIDSKISDLKADKILYDTYLKEKEKVEEKTKNEAALKKNIEQQKEKKKEKIKLLNEISDKCKIKDLKFNENGDIVFQDTAFDMLSTSQIMNLSSECAALYPEGLGIELIDRGESLGFASKGTPKEAISIYINRAKRGKKTILATVVGQNPAKIPEDVGVFIVDQGKIKNQEIDIEEEFEDKKLML